MGSGDLYNQLAGELRQDMREKLTIVRSSMEYLTRQDAPHVSGVLRDSITMTPFEERFDSYSATIAVDDQRAPQGRWTNEGTGEYIGNGRIYPKTARALSFFWLKIGKHVVFASVAGQPGQHWWDGPSGGREEERLQMSIDAAFGS